MDYLWEAIQTKEYETYFIKQIDSFCPYNENIRIDHESQIIYYNCMFRFIDVFRSLFENGHKIDEVSYNYLIDLFSRSLAEIDLREEISERNISTMNVIQKMNEGYYGKSILRYLECLDKESVYEIAYYIDLAEKKGESRLFLFAKVITSCIEDAKVYLDKKSGMILICIPRKRNMHDDNLIYIAKFFFLSPVQKCKVIWDGHFAVIDENELMLVDEMVLV